ncbi:MAG: hypothetical protein ACOCTL_03055 [Candidatus Hadarchaeota archaeon]
MNIEALLIILAPFLIGLLVGAIVKKALNLLLLGAALIIILIAVGALSLSYEELYDKALDTLPELWSEGQGWIGILPYSSVGFLIGLALGLWKG